LKAVILAAGKGERLKPFTEKRPKHLLPVGGRPILEWILKGLKKHGVIEALLVTNYMEDKIKNKFGDGSDIGLKIRYIRQEKFLGTADAFRTCEHFLSQKDFIGLYGDLYVSPESFKAIFKAHETGKTIISTVPMETPQQMGIVKLEGNRVVDIEEKPTRIQKPHSLVNAGVYFFTNEIFDQIRKTGLSKRNEYEITDSLKKLIASGADVKTAILPEDGWLDIGLPWNLIEANEKALSHQNHSIEGNLEPGAHITGKVRIDEGSRIRSGSYIEGPVYIGPGSDIGPNCHIRPGSSIGANVRIGNACEVKNSIIMDKAHIAHLSYVGDSVIGEGCNLGAGTITANIRFDRKTIKVQVKGTPIDSGRRKLGALMGDYAQTGINVNIMPGIKIGSETIISPGITVYEDVPPNTFHRSLSS
jgi:bifunctional UDP-N-acetylglucosamine pyrophosphorylase/glucosamine-1-phosphate N-acetyltransferase